MGLTYCEVFVVKGIIYILTNELFPHLVKIGHTTENRLIARVRELSGTGLPSPFVCAKYFIVADKETAMHVERATHAKLSDRRFNEGKEFFKLTVDEAVSVISVIIGTGPVKVIEDTAKYKGIYSKELLSDINYSTKPIIYGSRKMTHGDIIESDTAVIADILMNCKDKNLSVSCIFNYLFCTSHEIKEDDFAFGSAYKYKTKNDFGYGRFYDLCCGEYLYTEDILRALESDVGDEDHKYPKLDKLPLSEEVNKIFTGWGIYDTQSKLYVLEDDDSECVHIMPSDCKLAPWLISKVTGICEDSLSIWTYSKMTEHRDIILHVMEMTEDHATFENKHFVDDYWCIDSKGIVINGSDFYKIKGLIKEAKK